MARVDFIKTNRRINFTRQLFPETRGRRKRRQFASGGIRMDDDENLGKVRATVERRYSEFLLHKHNQRIFRRQRTAGVFAWLKPASGTGVRLPRATRIAFLAPADFVPVATRRSRFGQERSNRKTRIRRYHRSGYQLSLAPTNRTLLPASSMTLPLY
jgi:hypothetical protein